MAAGGKQGGGITTQIILAGIASSQLFNAITSLIITRSANAEQARGIMYWLYEDDQRTNAMMDMLLAKKRSEDRRNWLQEKGDLADLEG